MTKNKQVRKRGNGWGSSKGATWRAIDLLIISLPLLLLTGCPKTVPYVPPPQLGAVYK